MKAPDGPDPAKPPPGSPPPERAGAGGRPPWVDERIAEILADVSDRRACGETVNVAALIRSNPQLAPHLENDLAFHLVIAASQSTPPKRGRADSDEVDIFQEFPAKLGEYEVLEKLGSGAMGQVYLARKPSMGRLVALKLISPRHAGNRCAVERFVREAKAAARMDHPAIVTVYDAGMLGSMPFIAMRYVEGETLSRAIQREAEACRASGASQPVLPRDKIPRFLHLIERAARAIHAAHEEGLIHRDIKPSNIMVTPEGEAVVLDMGLVRLDVPDEQSLTVSGDILGTPAYMAPELLQDGDDRASRRSDVYSLGVTLFETLTLRLPFTAPTFAALTQKILHDDPPDARGLNPRVEKDLKAVLETALDKDPKRRYGTALELAEELRRVREFEPVRARSLGPAGRFVRWTRRNPIPAWSTIAAFSILVLGLAETSTLLYRLAKETDAKDAALGEKQAALDRAEGARLAAYSSVWLTADPGLALAAALEAVGRAPGSQAEDATLAAFEKLHERRTLFGHEATVNEACFTHDGRRVVTASSDYSVRVWDASTGTLLSILRGHLNGVFSCEVSPDDRRAVTASSDGTAIIWDLATGRRVAVLAGDGPNLNCARFSADGSLVVTSDEGGIVTIWRASNGSQVHSFRAAATSVLSVAFSPNGRLIATGARSEPGKREGPGAIWDAATGAQLHKLKLHEKAVTSVAFDATGRQLITASNDKTIAIWDAESGSRSDSWQAHDGEVLCARFSPDGKSIVTCSADLSVKVWDVQTHDVSAFLGHTRKVFCARFSSDGRQLVSSGVGSPGTELEFAL